MARHSKPAPRTDLSASTSDRRRRRSAAIRERLFRASLELFAQKGFAETTVEDITQAADVGKGTFFNYFPTKEYLLAELVELRLDIYRGARIETEDGLAKVREILRRLFFRLVEEPGRSPGIARCMLLGLLGSEPLAMLAQKTAAKAREILSEIMAAGQQRGEIRRDVSADDLAHLFQQTFFGFVHLWALL